jgi:hypothetical protein
MLNDIVSVSMKRLRTSSCICTGTPFSSVRAMRP